MLSREVVWVVGCVVVGGGMVRMRSLRINSWFFFTDVGRGASSVSKPIGAFSLSFPTYLGHHGLASGSGYNWICGIGKTVDKATT